MKRSLFCLYAAIVFLLCACAAPSYGSLAEAEADEAKLGENIRIDGVDVSGLSVQEAAVRLDEALKAVLAERVYRISSGRDILEIPASAFSIRFDTDKALLEALALPRRAPDGTARELSSPASAELEALRATLSKETETLNAQAQNATAKYDPSAEGRFVFTEATPGRVVDVHALALELQSHIQTGDDSPFEAPFSELSPTYTAEQAREDHQLVAEFSTSFAGGTYGGKSRVFNIKKAVGLIDGVTVEPGKEFDMNATLGPRNGETGWKQATGIREGAYVQEFGGGVCQVSSTLYNTVLMADLPVTLRYHHSWPLGYIDEGRDATISTDGPNFCFENSQEVPVTLSAEADTKAKTITVRIYGRPLPDGTTISIRSKRTATLNNLGTEYVVDRSLAPGQTEEVRKSRRGLIAVTWKEYYSADGELLRKEQVSEDKYRSIRGLVKISG